MMSWREKRSKKVQNSTDLNNLSNIDEEQEVEENNDFDEELGDHGDFGASDEDFEDDSEEINATRFVDLKQKINIQKQKLMTTLKTNANKKKLKNLKAEVEELESKFDRKSLSEVYNALRSPGRAFLFPNILVLLEWKLQFKRLFKHLKI